MKRFLIFVVFGPLIGAAIALLLDSPPVPAGDYLWLLLLGVVAGSYLLFTIPLLVAWLFDRGADDYAIVLRLIGTSISAFVAGVAFCLALYLVDINHPDADPLNLNLARWIAETSLLFAAVAAICSTLALVFDRQKGFEARARQPFTGDQP